MVKARWSCGRLGGWLHAGCERHRLAHRLGQRHVVNYCFPKIWPNDRELRARIIGEWLTTEASYLAS
jgi:hypothetical protein